MTKAEKERAILANYNRDGWNKTAVLYLAQCGREFADAVLAKHGLSWPDRGRSRRGFNGHIGKGAN